MSNWTIVKTAYAPNHLNIMWPHAVSHDGVNSVFVSEADEKDIEVFYEGEESLKPAVYKKVDLTHYAISDPQLLYAAGKLLADPDFTDCIILTNHQAKELFKSPVHRLWCANYEDAGNFAADYEIVFGKVPTVDKLEARKQIVEMFK